MTDFVQGPAQERLARVPYLVPVEVVAVVVLGAVALGLRAFWIGHPALSAEEIRFILAARGTVADAFAAEAAPGAVSAPYTLLLQGMVALFGEDRAALRAPSALLGAAAVPVLYFLVRECLEARVAYLAALFLTCLPPAVAVCRQVGPDAGMTFLLLLAAWMLVRLIRSDDDRRWVQAGLAAVLALALAAAPWMRPSAVAVLPLFVLAAYAGCGWEIRKLGLILLSIFGAWLVSLPQATGFFSIAADRLAVSPLDWGLAAEVLERVRASAAVPALTDPLVGAVYAVGALVLLWVVPRFAAAVLILHLGAPAAVAAAGPLLSGLPMPAVGGLAALATVLVAAAVAILPKLLAAGAAMLLLAFQLLHLVPLYPFDRVPNPGDDLRAELDALPADAAVFYDRGVLDRFTAFRRVGTDWTPLRVENLPEGANLISAHLANCAGVTCGPVAIVMVRAPRYFAAAAEDWMAEMDALAAWETVLRDADVAGYRMLVLQPPGDSAP